MKTKPKNLDQLIQEKIIDFFIDKDGQIWKYYNVPEWAEQAMREIAHATADALEVEEEEYKSMSYDFHEDYRCGVESVLEDQQQKRKEWFGDE